MKRADLENPRDGVVSNLRSIAKESALCLDKVRNGIAGLASLVKKYPESITPSENKLLHEVLSPLLDLIEGYASHVSNVEEAAVTLENTPTSISPETEEEEEEEEGAMPAAASTKLYLRKGRYIYRKEE